MAIDPSGKIPSPRYEQQALKWKNCNLNRLAERYGTPLHVGCSEAVRSAIHHFKAPFKNAGLSVCIYYSVKTNPLPVYLDRVHKSGCGFEIVNSHEAHLLNSLQIPAKKITLTGIPEEDSFPYPLEDLHIITISSVNQLQKLISFRHETSKPINVGITIRPGLWRAYWDITLNTSRQKSPVGVEPSSTQFNELLRFIAESPGIKLTGLHMHLGSGIRSAAPYRKGIQVLERAAIQAAERSLKISSLNIGGGFGLTSAPMLKVRNIVSSLLGITRSGKTQSYSSGQLESISKQITNTTKRLESKGIEIDEIAAEPGRIFSGPCQILLLTVKEVVSLGTNQNYLVCDSGAMSLSPMLLTEQHRILSLTDKPGPRIQYEVLGPLPSALDRISSSARLPKMKAGDRIAVLDTGAYILPMNNGFTGPCPAVAWIENGEVQLARRRETKQDIYSRDLMPDKLEWSFSEKEKR